MSIEKIAFKGASWLALFRFISQLFSWSVTVIVARILTPDDYGLMAMATIITGYAMLFNELGLGAAIIQRNDISEKELSSVFWFSMVVSALFALSTFAVAYPTAWIFNEPRVVPITMTVSVIFIINGLQIVPSSLMKKEMNFKTFGMIEMIGIIISCCGMLLIATLGGGVWTLIGGYIIKGIINLILFYVYQGWFPGFHFNFLEVKHFISFGILVSLGGSFHYIFVQSDRFFAGRAWASTILGYYAFACQLALIPTDKIVTLINQVSFSVFSKLKDSKEEFNRFYLNINKMTATLVLPLFIGGYLVGEEIIKLLLNEQWWPIITLFQYLCLAQIITSLNAVNNFVHTAQGRPIWRLYFYATCAILMSVSFYFAVQHGMNAILIPWFTTYLCICIAWVILTLRQIQIPVSIYVKNLYIPICATSFMAVAVLFSGVLFDGTLIKVESRIFALTIKIVSGAVAYIGFLLIYDLEYLKNIIRLFTPTKNQEQVAPLKEVL
jgi:O-antigen/teichoic acid export membrane protein